MSLEAEFEAFAEENAPRMGPLCKVCALPDEIRELVEKAAARGRPCSVIAQFLDTKGFVLSEGSLRRHVRSGCVNGRRNAR